jgi:integrase
MLPIPEYISVQFNNVLRQRAIPESFHVHYRKWLRYFLDYCEKYPPPEAKTERVRLFIEKLKSKKQTPRQCTQAAHAISLFFESHEAKNRAPSGAINVQRTPASPASALVKPRNTNNAAGGIESAIMPAATIAESRAIFGSPGGKRHNEWRCLEKSKSPAWDQAIEKLSAEIKIRHYSRKTLKTYADWARKFQRFLSDKPPEGLSSLDVKEYLTYLAVKRRVASSTQNQAFNALLFLFRHVLKKEYGEMRDVPRAKRSKYIPVVLSREEIDIVLSHLEYPFDTVVGLLYGCGLRLFECLGLRVQNFNFDDGILTVHGKGDKDRTIPLPKKLTTKLKTRLEMLRELHDKDLASGYAGVFLPDSLEKKYPDNAGPCRCEDNDDLYSLRAKQNCQRSEKSFGFLTFWHGLCFYS